MSQPRFLVPELPREGVVLLEDAEARHASHVLRLQAGEHVVLFDGCGGEALASIVTLAKRSVEVRLVRRLDTQRELAASLELIVALPKGDRQRTLVDGLVQLGVEKLTPLQSLRSVAQPGPSAIGRLQRAVIESSKQCGRNLLMQIGQPVSIEDLVDGSQIPSFIAHPYGAGRTLRSVPCDIPRTRCVVGPEGGLADEECQLLLASGWSTVYLGSRILRVEIAALMVASWWACCSER